MFFQNIFKVLFISVIIIYLSLSIWANKDLTQPHTLDIDEMITYTGVHNILHPDSIKDFYYAVTDGGDHRYGRILWNSMAAIAFIPSIIGGDEAQIFVGRMTQSVILVAAFIILTITLIKNWGFRLLSLCLLLSMPIIPYYASMPKPEPQQILFLAIFIYFYKKYEFIPNKFYWIFLGLAFGAKISTLPIAVAFFTYSIVILKLKNENIPSIAPAIGFFITGYAIAIPIFIKYAAISIATFNLTKQVMINKNIDYKKLKYFTLNILFCLLSTAVFYAILYFMLGDNSFERYYKRILAETTNAKEHANFITWVKFISKSWFKNSFAYLTAIVTTSIIAIYIFIKEKLLQKNNMESFLKESFPAFITIVGAITNLLIMLAVPRTWGIYMFLGSALFIPGVINITEQLLSCNYNKINK